LSGWDFYLPFLGPVRAIFLLPCCWAYLLVVGQLRLDPATGSLYGGLRAMLLLGDWWLVLPIILPWGDGRAFVVAPRVGLGHRSGSLWLLSAAGDPFGSLLLSP
jgi:hypothetical protein